MFPIKTVPDLSPAEHTTSFICLKKSVDPSQDNLGQTYWNVHSTIGHGDLHIMLTEAHACRTIIYAEKLLMFSFSSADFFKINFFEKVLKQSHQCQTFWIQISSMFNWSDLSPNSLQRYYQQAKELTLV